MSSPATSLLTRLEELVGAANVLAAPTQLAGYEVDGLGPAAVVRPGSVEEVAQVVRFAAAEKLAVIPVGARTKLGIGAPPHRYDLAMDMTRLGRVLAYDPGDLTLGVEAGIGLAKLANVLAEHRQVLPLAVPFTNQTTAGGTLASDMDTPLRQFYGPPRDFVLGIEFVTGEGALAKSGGRVVKNVTGYDLHKLLIGALGTLGILTRINFRTFPQPLASRGFLAAFPHPGSALELRHRIAQSPLTPATLEILSPEVAQVFARSTPATLDPLPLPGTWFPTSHWLLAAAFAGNERVLERYAKELTRMAEQAGAINFVVLGDQERPLVWGRLREFIPLMLESSPAATLVRIVVLPTRLGETLVQAQQIAERHALLCAALARGVGVVYVALLPPALDAAALGRLAQACTSLFELSGSLGGQAMVQWCPTELKSQVNVWGPPRDDWALMHRLKKVFDPQGILSPGRFVGGI